jgi:nucleotide-binding universal stress UspA family protein
MYQNILIAYDGSIGAKNAMKIGAELSKKLNARLSALWVAGSLPQYHETKAEIDEEINYEETYFNKLQEEIINYSSQYQIDIRFSYLKGNAAKTIVEYSKEKLIDLIIISHSGHSNLWGKFLGHVPYKVSNNANCDVLIVRKYISF